MENDPIERDIRAYTDSYWHETFDAYDEDGVAIVLGGTDTIALRIAKTLTDAASARTDITLVSTPDILVYDDAGTIDAYIYELGLDPGTYRYALFWTQPAVEQGAVDTVTVLYTGTLVVERSVVSVPELVEA